MSVLLLGATAPAASFLGRRYGRLPGRRCATVMASMLLLQQLMVGLAVVRSDGQHDAEDRRQLTLADLVTLTRGWTAALLLGLIASGVRDRRGAAGWMGWLAVLYGAGLCDWLDGPIARQRGTSEIGALLDLEADSWLTLCAAGGAVTWGALPSLAAGPPLLRYLLLFDGLRTRRYADLHSGEPPWVRRMGIVQMLLFIAAMAPFRGGATAGFMRLIARVEALLQLGGLILLHRQRRGA